jgi:chromosomal replication initiator protein
LYIPATKLIDNIIQSIRKNKLTKFIADFTKVDVLLIDDIQFLSGKEKTQEIFLTIFNELVMNNKQIVMSSDQAPRELSNIEPRLKTRFAK